MAGGHHLTPTTAHESNRLDHNWELLRVDNPKVAMRRAASGVTIVNGAIGP